MESREGRARAAAKQRVALQHVLVGRSQHRQLVEVVHHEHGVEPGRVGLPGLLGHDVEQRVGADARIGEVGDLVAEAGHGWIRTLFQSICQPVPRSAHRSRRLSALILCSRPRMSRGWDSRQQRTRAEVLAAVGAIIAADGLDGLTMRKLADRAGVAVATLYNQFDDRNGVLVAFVSQGLDELELELDEQPAAEPIDGTRVLFEALDSTIGSRVDIWRPVLATLKSNPTSQRMGAVGERIIASIENDLAKAQASAMLYARVRHRSARSAHLRPVDARPRALGAGHDRLGPVSLQLRNSASNSRWRPCWSSRTAPIRSGASASSPDARRRLRPPPPPRPDRGDRVVGPAAPVRASRPGGCDPGDAGR